jgi:ABC-type uncharacterized transport system substrate-binding protein
MKRRDFLTLLGGAAAAWPLAARAQQPGIPVVGYLSAESPDDPAYAARRREFQQGLQETGYVEGKNVAIDYRWAEGHSERFPAFAAEFVRRRVSVIVANAGSPALLAAKAATATIPIVFEFGGDPVRRGIVASLSHPGGNLTGITSLTDELGPKRLELLREVITTARVFGFLLNPANQNVEIVASDLQAAASALGLEAHIRHASNERELEPAFAAFAELRVGGIVIGGDPLFNSHYTQLGALCLRYSMPAIYQYRALRHPAA